jgi:hypothetical protein
MELLLKFSCSVGDVLCFRYLLFICYREAPPNYDRIDTNESKNTYITSDTHPELGLFSFLIRSPYIHCKYRIKMVPLVSGVTRTDKVGSYPGGSSKVSSTVKAALKHIPL